MPFALPEACVLRGLRFRAFGLMGSVQGGQAFGLGVWGLWAFAGFRAGKSPECSCLSTSQI